VSTVIKVPALGAAIANITIVRWLVAEGDEVKRGEPLLEVETDKMNMDIPAECDGVLQQILAAPGVTTQEGDPLAVIGASGEAVGGGEVAAPPVLDETPPPDVAAAVNFPRSSAAPGRVAATPAARRVANELDLDLALVRATGETVTEADVRRHHRDGGQVGAAADDVEVIPLVGARKLLADRMAESFRTVPHYTMTLEFDCTRLVALRRELEDALGERVTHTALFVKAVALAVRDEPIANATLVGDEIHVFRTAHVGVAVAAGDMIVVPVIRSPISHTVPEIARELTRLTELGRSRRLPLDAVTGATITISNVGATEVVSANTIINPPEVAMIAITRIVDRATPIDGIIAVRPRLNASFTYDHRVVQGVPGARFAERVKYYVEHPDELVAAVA